MSDAFVDMLDGYEEVDARQPDEREALPDGYYPLEVYVQDKGITSDNSPYVRLRLRIFEGPHANRSVFTTHWLGHKRAESVNDLYDNEKVAGLTPDQATRRRKARAQAINKKLLEALEVDKGVISGEDADKIFNFYNVDAWDQRQLIGKLRSTPSKNPEYGPNTRMTSFYSINDPKHGLDWWRSQQGSEVSVGTL